MNKANEWLESQKQNESSIPRWESKGAFFASAELYYRGLGSGALLRLSHSKGYLLLAPVDALSLGKWLLEMYGETA